MTSRRLTLALPDPHPRVAVAETIDPDAGTVRYRIRGPRATGTIVSAPELRGTEPIPTEIRIQLGDGGPHIHDHDRDDLPVINTITLAGGIVLKPTSYLASRPHPFGLRRPHGRYHSSSAPDITNRYASAIIRSLVRTWHHHPDRDHLVLAAARRAAPRRLAQLHRDEIQPILARIEELQNKLLAVYRRADELQQLAREPDPDPR